MSRGTTTLSGDIKVEKHQMKWDPKTLEIRTHSVEKTLEPLVHQVSLNSQCCLCQIIPNNPALIRHDFTIWLRQEVVCQIVVVCGEKLLDLYVRSAAIATHTLCICIAAWDFLTKRGINYSWKQQLRLSFLLQCAVKSVLVSLFHRKHHLVRRFFSSDKWRVLALKICPLIRLVMVDFDTFYDYGVLLINWHCLQFNDSQRKFSLYCFAFSRSPDFVYAENVSCKRLISCL